MRIEERSEKVVHAGKVRRKVLLDDYQPMCPKQS